MKLKLRASGECVKCRSQAVGEPIAVRSNSLAIKSLHRLDIQRRQSTVTEPLHG
jgi:hypothetical protein